jgi:hypothetical protein
VYRQDGGRIAYIHGYSYLKWRKDMHNVKPSFDLRQTFIFSVVRLVLMPI